MYFKEGNSWMFSCW